MLKKKYKVVITDYFKDSIIEKKILGDEAHVICLDQIEENKFTDEIDDADILLVWHAEISDKTINSNTEEIKEQRSEIDLNIDINNGNSQSNSL